MKVLFLQRDLPCNGNYGGVATQVHDLANALIKIGVEVTVASISGKPEDAAYEHHKIELPSFVNSSRFLKRYLLGYYFKKIDKEVFDVIHSHGDNFLLFGGRPQVRTFYGTAFMEFVSARTWKRKIAQLISFLLEWVGALAADYRTAISPDTARFLPNVNRIVPCGVDKTVFYPAGVKSENPTILYVGSVYDRKRGDRLLGLMPDLRQVYPAIELIVAGPERVNGAGITYVDRPDRSLLAGLYRKAWLLVSSSDYEGFGLPALEAMASGTAVVAVENAGSGYLCGNGKYGTLCSKETLFETIVEHLGDSDKRKQIAANGALRAEEFEIIKVAEIYREVYAGVIKK
ncbi:MAG: glycosyltransferase family 4 protein [Fibrobacteres bacterium]|nr:glycosyltransferase family 4 protein [Fibrobacterota bacterium]